MTNSWVKYAIGEIEADFQRSADTHLIRLNLPAFPGICLYLKDEHPPDRQPETPPGALAVPLWAVQRLDHREHHHHRGLFRQHRGVRSLLRSSDRPAVHRGDAILHRAPQGGADRLYGGRCHFVDHAAQIYAASEQLAKELNGHYMDQFTYAERATDWRGNNNIADSIFRQMAREPSRCRNTS